MNTISKLEEARIAARIRKAERRIARESTPANVKQEEQQRIFRLNRVRSWGGER